MSNRRSFFARVAAAGLALVCPRRSEASDAIRISQDDQGNVFEDCTVSDGGPGDGIYFRGPGKDFEIIVAGVEMSGMKVVEDRQ